MQGSWMFQASIGLMIFAAGGVLGRHVESLNHEGTNAVAKKQSAGWAGLDSEGFLDSALLILGDDGEQACFIPMTEPVLEAEQTPFGKTTRAVVKVIRCGDDIISPCEQWHVQELRMSKGQCRSYRTHAEGYEGSRILRMTRHGVKGDQKTRYAVEVADPAITEDNVALAAKLLSESEK